MRKMLLGFVVVLVVCFAAYLRLHRPERPLGIAYAADHEVTLWNTTAQVREPMATLNYGDRLDVLERSGDKVRVRTAAGVIGWTAQADLLSGDLWQKAQDLEAKTASSPVQARGHTRVLSNLRLEPGRDAPRIRQLSKGVPVESFVRQALEVPVAAAAAAGTDGTASAEPAEAKKEDWWLVRAHLPDQNGKEVALSGWLLGRFVDLDVPAPLPDYASAAGMHIVGWFDLNHVPNAAGGAKAQYLVVGTRGPEGQPCDFTLMRVFTWGKQRQRYETAFVESEVCGRLPVKVTPAPGGDITFVFENWNRGAAEHRTYHMHQTVVRRIREGGSSLAGHKHGQ
jgi:hypothetical protein